MVRKTEVSAQGNNSECTLDFNGDSSPYVKLRKCIILKGFSEKGGWSCPSRGFVKLNVDASFDHDLLMGMMGAVLRDEKGRFIAGGNKKIDYCADVLMAEV